MQVKTSAFTLSIQGITLEEYLSYLRDNYTYSLEKRFLIVDKIDGKENLWGGFLLTMRDEKETAQVRLDGNRLEVILAKVQDGFDNGLFNFFLINTKTTKGLYQTYQHSAPITKFFFHLNHLVNKYASDRRRNDITFSPSPLFRKEAFEEYVKKFDTIKEIIIEPSYYKAREPFYQGLSSEADRYVHTFKYYQYSPRSVEKIVDSLIGIFNKNKPKALKIKGKIGDLERLYDVANDVEIYDQMDYNEWVKNLAYSVNDIKDAVNQSAAVRLLLDVYARTLPLTRLDIED